MAVTITHTTPADGTFSATGAAAWDANHAVSGLGTMAEQNASNVAITGGNIDGTAIGVTTQSSAKVTTFNASSTVTLSNYTGYVYANGAGAITAATTIPNSGLANSSVTINGTSVSLGGSTTISASTTGTLTLGTGLSGTSFNGSTNVTAAIADTTVVAAAYGSSSAVATFTVNAQGQLTAAANATISIAASQINTTIPLTGGGTGATTQAGAANAILPSQTSNAGKYLTTDGSNVSWASVSGSGVTLAEARKVTSLRL